MKLDYIMQEMQKDFELKQPIPQVAAGLWQVTVEEGLTILISQSPQGISITCSFMDAPIGKEGDLYLELLNANLFGQGTKGSLLSLSDDGRKLTLSRIIEYDIDYKDFQDIFEDFVNSIDFWREEALTYQQ